MDQWFEREMPNAANRPLFERAEETGIGLCLGYAELTEEEGEIHRYNLVLTSVRLKRE